MDVLLLKIKQLIFTKNFNQVTYEFWRNYRQNGVCYFGVIIMQKIRHTSAVIYLFCFLYNLDEEPF